ncbi:MAG: 6-phosphogluconolactonase [Pseudomonadota bacterium]|nr:6-phosphogluconolactonase [Rubrivivax sp.]
MHIEVLPDAAAAGERAARRIAECAEGGLRERGRFLLALSGGHTPQPMYEALARLPLAWRRVALFQADERAVPPASEARNWSHVARLLLAPLGASGPQTHPMPAMAAHELDAAAAEYAQTLVAAAGAPPQLDLVHLGLGSDGHTASLFAGDAALEVDDAWVAATGVQQGHRRLTLTLPALARARRSLWLVCGADKAAALARLLAGERGLPAARLPRRTAWVVADAAACPGRAPGVEEIE